MMRAVPVHPSDEDALIRVLMVDDSADDAELVMRELRRASRPVSVERVWDAAEMRTMLARNSWDLVLSDWTMPRFGGDAALEVLKATSLDVPFIIVSGTVTEELAIKAMRAGARDWVLKGKLGRLLPAIERELEDRAERKRREEILRQSEEKLRQSQKLDAIGGLAAGVAHDFNNVLSVIIGHADLLLLEGGKSDPYRDSVEEIRNAAARAADLTRQLLAFSRQQILQPRRTDISTIVASMTKMLRRLIGEDIDLDIPAPPTTPVMVDPGQMAQVILNLAVNARDAMPNGGRLEIATRDVVVGESSPDHPGVGPGAYVVLRVSDTGIGMDAATRGRIFEPFFTTKEPGKGTGLGLSTVFGIVEQSGGAIVTKSELGKGTTFEIYLPQKAAAAGPDLPVRPAPRTKRAARRGTETLLLVEDDDAVRALLRAVLQRHGYRVLDAPNGREALLLCETVPGRIDLVLTDVVMPHMSGREFAARLEVLRPGIKVLYMSGYTDGAIVRHGVLEPGIAFIQKPVTPAVLIDKVLEMLAEGENGDRETP
jgi:signal transduction histidine kinase